MAENPQPELDIVVAEDGSASIPAELLKSVGVKPGAHLRVVPATEATKPKKKYKSIMGALEGQIDVEAFEEAMAWGKQQRIAEVMREDDSEK